MTQLDLLDTAPDETALIASRVRDCLAAGLPTTVEECISLLVRNTRNGRPSRSWEVMTPSRYTHATDLLRAGASPAIVTAAVDRINASGWVKKPVSEVTEEDLPRAAALAAERGAR